MDELARKYFGGELTQNERLELLRRAETDGQLYEALIRHQNICALLALAPRRGDSTTAYREFRAFRRRQNSKTVRRLTMTSLRYAAVVLIAVAATWSLAYINNKQHTTGTMQTLYVPEGQRISITLDDNTVVWLNSRTKISYPSVFGADERRVSLEGEAYFEVNRDANRPFIVRSGDMEIKVLGTSFNIHSYPNEAVSRVSLIDGSLQVSAKGSATTDIILEPDYEAVFDGKDLSVVRIRNKNHFLWTQGIYVFENETLGAIVKQLELYYDIKINVLDNAMLQWRYTVKFRQRDGIREILRLLQEIHHFSMAFDETDNTVYISK